MESKVIEIRDRCTFIPALAVRLRPANERERYLVAHAGYGITGESQEQYVILTRLVPPVESHHDPYEWIRYGRTMPLAHRHLIANWADVLSGDVVDVEFLLGESSAPKHAEKIDEPDPA